VDEYYYDLFSGQEVVLCRTPELSEGCDEYSMEKVIRYWLEGDSYGIPTIEVLEKRDYRNRNQSIVLVDPKYLIQQEDGSYGYSDEVNRELLRIWENGQEVLVFVLDEIHEVVKTWKKTYQELQDEFVTEYNRLLRESGDELGKEKDMFLYNRLYEKYEPYMEVWNQELKKVS